MIALKQQADQEQQKFEVEWSQLVRESLLTFSRYEAHFAHSHQDSSKLLLKLLLNLFYFNSTYVNIMTGSAH
jgi:hypothetical protein